MPPNLRRFVVAKVHVGSNGAGESIFVQILRPVRGLALGSMLGYLMYGGTSSRLNERLNQTIRDREEKWSRSEKEWSALVTKVSSQRKR